MTCIWTLAAPLDQVHASVICPQLHRIFTGIIDLMDTSLSRLQELVMDREVWRATVRGLTKSQTRLSSWTELTCMGPSLHPKLLYKNNNYHTLSNNCTTLCTRFFYHWLWLLVWEDHRNRKWQPTPVLLPGKFHGQRSLVGYSTWGPKELDMTEWLSMHIHDIGTTLTFILWLRKLITREGKSLA